MKAFLSSLFSILFTPRRSFAYRQLEERLRDVTAERNEYKDLWQSAMRYIAYEEGKPRFGEEEKGEGEVRQADEPARPTLAELQTEFEQEKERRFLAWQLEQKSSGQPNDLPN
jgi:hypothetical protein